MAWAEGPVRSGRRSLPRGAALAGKRSAPDADRSAIRLHTRDGMHRPLLLFAVMVALAAGCSDASRSAPAQPAPPPGPALPEPEATLPRAPARLAARLVTTTGELDS